MRHILKEYIEKNFAPIEMKKLIKYKGKYSVRPLVKEEEGFYEKAEKKKIEPPKNYGMMATKAMILLVGERRVAHEITRRTLLKRKSV